MTTLYRRITIEKTDGLNRILDSKVFEIGDVVELESMVVNTFDPKGINFSPIYLEAGEMRDKQFLVIGKRQIEITKEDHIANFVLRDGDKIRITHDYDVVRLDDLSVSINNVGFSYIRLDSFKELMIEC